jgi:hypothetical protein
VRKYQTTDDVIAKTGLPAGWEPPVSRPAYGPLTTNEHILHLLLTVFTGGLWLPVWIYLAMRGSRR